MRRAGPGQSQNRGMGGGREHFAVCIHHPLSGLTGIAIHTGKLLHLPVPGKRRGDSCRKSLQTEGIACFRIASVRERTGLDWRIASSVC